MWTHRGLCQGHGLHLSTAEVPVQDQPAPMPTTALLRNTAWISMAERASVRGALAVPRYCSAPNASTGCSYMQCGWAIPQSRPLPSLCTRSWKGTANVRSLAQGWTRPSQSV